MTTKTEKRQYRTFSEDEIATIVSALKDGYEIDAIAELLDRDKKSIYMKIQHLHKIGIVISNPKKRRPWTDTEIQDLKDLIGKGYTIEDISERISRSVGSINGMLQQIRKTIQKVDNKYHTWTDQDDTLLGDVQMGTISIHEAVDQIKTSFKNVKGRLTVLKRLGNKPLIRKYFDSGKSEQEISQITGIDIVLVCKHVQSIEDDVGKRRLYNITVDNVECDEERCYKVSFPKRNFNVVPENDMEWAILRGEYRCKSYAELQTFTSTFKDIVEKMSKIDLSSLIDLMV